MNTSRSLRKLPVPSFCLPVFCLHGDRRGSPPFFVSFFSGPGNGYRTPPSQGIPLFQRSSTTGLGSLQQPPEAHLANQDGAKRKGARGDSVNVSGLTMLERDGGGLGTAPEMAGNT